MGDDVDRIVVKATVSADCAELTKVQMKEQGKDMYEKRPGTDEIEIDLMKIMQVLLQKARFIIAVALLIAAVTFGATYFFITPLYTSTALMYVNNSGFSLGNTSFSISQGELTAAQGLVDTYIVLLKSRTTLEDIIDKCSLEYDYEELRDMIEAEAVNSTEIFSVDVTSTSPREAERIANTIAQVLPERIASIVDGSDVRIVDYAVVPSERTSPSFTINTMIGALAGFVLAAIIVVLRYMLDDQIRGEDYLTQAYPNIPLLAVVPDMTSAESKGYFYHLANSDSEMTGRAGIGKMKPRKRATAQSQHSRNAQVEKPRQTQRGRRAQKTQASRGADRRHGRKPTDSRKKA